MNVLGLISQLIGIETLRLTDVVFDEKAMTKAFKEEKSQAAESSNNISKSMVQVELDELES